MTAEYQIKLTWGLCQTLNIVLQSSKVETRASFITAKPLSS